MSRFMLTLVFALALSVSAVSHPNNGSLLAADGPHLQTADAQLVEGMVVSASAGQVSVRTADGKEHSFKPNAMTRIMVNGKPGKLEDLKPGTQIRVMVDKQSKVISISTIDDRKSP